MKHKLWGEITALVLLKLFICANERCHTTDTNTTNFFMKEHATYKLKVIDTFNYLINNKTWLIFPIIYSFKYLQMYYFIMYP